MQLLKLVKVRINKSQPISTFNLNHHWHFVSGPVNSNINYRKNILVKGAS